jgi:hypothetical protein
VRKEIGPIATPDVIQWAPGLPKTRSGKIMRRILRKIAANDFEQLGDTSTLADPRTLNPAFTIDIRWQIPFTPPHIAGSLRCESPTPMNWFNTVLTERLGIRYPIIQAPMAGGAGTPQLVAAVANAGGMGSLAGGYLQPGQLRQAIAEVRTLTDQPFAVNLAVSAPAKADPAQISRAYQLLAPYRAELGLPPDPPPLTDPPEFEQQLDVVLEEGVSALSFIFGVPDAVYLEMLRDAGVVTLGTATHLLEAILLEESGVDFIIAQGAEAGGHRGTFIGHPEQGRTFA